MASKKGKKAPHKKAGKLAKLAKALVKAATGKKKEPEKKPLPPVKELKKELKKGEKRKAPAEPLVSAPTKRPDGWMGPLPDKPLPRQTKLPNEMEPLNKREMEQVLSVGTRGVAGEGSLKGRLIVYQGFPYLEVIGRDKRELWFILQGPDQEVLPAYADHKVSVSGLIRRTHSYGGSVDVRKYSAKKPEQEAQEAAAVPVDTNKLRLLSPGEVEIIGSPGMGVGMRGFATLRGMLEMSGEEFYLVVSNMGTRQQVSFTIEGRGSKGLKKYVGQTVVATGVVEKTTAWGGRIESENCEPRAQDFPPVSRDSIEVVTVEGGTTSAVRDCVVKLNNGLAVRLAEKQGWVWAIEPQTAKRVSLREVASEHGAGRALREFFFTPRNPGVHDVEFFLGKALNPLQVSRTFKLIVNVKSPEVV